MTAAELRTRLTALTPSFDLLDIEILVSLFETRSTGATASKLGLTQGRVQHRGLRAVVMHPEVAALVNMPWMHPLKVA